MRFLITISVESPTRNDGIPRVGLLKDPNKHGNLFNFTFIPITHVGFRLIVNLIPALSRSIAEGIIEINECVSHDVTLSSGM
ncbi:hypothetical protein HanHA300_Chr01g0013171 [Helianthus annuus]|nr:hypothetical protein HanHA300_Chr01g0013171 [Helianthus annuus]KAJ0626538.1 hypothetical protein HanHA89_Chr01g0014311 [Helianthus annuus]